MRVRVHDREGLRQYSLVMTLHSREGDCMACSVACL